MPVGVTRPAWAFIAFTVICIAAALMLPAVPQPVEYHHFADQRAILGVEHFLNIVSNFGFLIAGLAGLALLAGGRGRFEASRERWPYAVFFLGLLLTAPGSTYYHLAPDNETLFWDRLPMTIAFMGLVASQVVDRISVRAGLALLGPMLLVGVASVVYWRATERVGAGNVLPYAILQGYTVVGVLMLAWLAPSRYTRGSDLYFVFGWYVFSKILEALDAHVMAFNQIVSGHTLKHVAASVAGLVIVRMLWKRSSRAPAYPLPDSLPDSFHQAAEERIRRSPDQ